MVSVADEKAVLMCLSNSVFFNGLMSFFVEIEDVSFSFGQCPFFRAGNCRVAGTQ